MFSRLAGDSGVLKKKNATWETSAWLCSVDWLTPASQRGPSLGCLPGPPASPYLVYYDELFPQTLWELGRKRQLVTSAFSVVLPGGQMTLERSLSWHGMSELVFSFSKQQSFGEPQERILGIMFEFFLFFFLKPTLELTFLSSPQTLSPPHSLCLWGRNPMGMWENEVGAYWVLWTWHWALLATCQCNCDWKR